MKNLQEAITILSSELDEIEAVREIAIRSARNIIKLSRKIIHSLHLGNDVNEELKALKEEVMNAKGLCEKIEASKIMPIIEDAYQEYAELMIFLAILKNKEIPSHRELGVTPSSYLLALGDVIGELRRYCLNLIKKGSIEESAKILETMEEIFSNIEVLDYPTAIVAIKPKVDMARWIIDRTRSDVIGAIVARGGR